MARDHARIRLDIWADEDFRDLTSSAQWLYLHLLASPTLTFCGTTDWRPPRIAAVTAELTGNDVETFAAELEAGRFIVVDRDTEEAMIRSFVKHDGLMKSPNMAKALAKDHALIASRCLRAVVVDQLKRLKEASPELLGWNHIGTLLRKRSMTPEEAFALLSPNPSVNPSGNPSVKGSGNPSGNPSATPFLPSSLPPRSTKGQVPYLGEQGDEDLTLDRSATKRTGRG